MAGLFQATSETSLGGGGHSILRENLVYDKNHSKAARRRGAHWFCSWHERCGSGSRHNRRNGRPASGQEDESQGGAALLCRTELLQGSRRLRGQQGQERLQGPRRLQHPQGRLQGQGTVPREKLSTKISAISARRAGGTNLPALLYLTRKKATRHAERSATSPVSY
jgi:hypothetical protein